MTPPQMPADPWASGPCVCGTCKHTWVGHWRVGSSTMQCPSCNAKDVSRTMENYPIAEPPPKPTFYDYE